jgi:transcriptional regulator with XRE-family HTH domain
MSIKRRIHREKLIRAFDQEMLRSTFVSIFWSAICYKKAHGGFSLKQLADKIGVNKSSPSRWFSGTRPNWEVNTIADIAGALDLEFSIEARDRATGVVFTAQGVKPEPQFGGSARAVKQEPQPPNQTTTEKPSDIDVQQIKAKKPPETKLEFAKVA